VRAALSLLLALAIGWSSVVDNSAVCHDDDGAANGGPCSDDGTPAAPCISCPCKLPLTVPTPASHFDPSTGARQEAVVWPQRHLHAIDASAPPTPPPLA
jgi:hypothetical protein